MTTPARRQASGPVRGSTRTHRTGVVRAAGSRGTPARSTPVRSTPSRPNLWLVADGGAARRARAGSARRRAPFVVLVVLLLVATTLGLLILNTAIAVDSLKATHLRTDNAQRAEDVQRLEQRVVDGSTPAELAAEAVRAGMVPAGPPAYLVIEPDGSSTVRGTAEPAEPPVPGGEG